MKVLSEEEVEQLREEVESRGLRIVGAIFENMRVSGNRIFLEGYRLPESGMGYSKDEIERAFNEGWIIVMSVGGKLYLSIAGEEIVEVEENDMISMNMSDVARLFLKRVGIRVESRDSRRVGG